MPEKLKIWTSSNCHKVYFLLKFCTCFLIKNDYNYINKNVKNECVETTYFSFLQKNSISKQNKKNPEHLFVDIGIQETSVKFQQKILNSMVVGARQNFQFFRKTWFLENNWGLSKSLYGILHYLISIVKL